MTSPSQLQREIDSALATRTADGRLPLYDHTSEATAYVVDDYPYGFTARTKIRYWLEKKANKGWRFVSQTLNPNTDRWNKPKPSTYIEWAAVMTLDGKGHVHWDGVGQYSDDTKILAFVKDFPEADMSVLRKVVAPKMKYLQGRISGALVWGTTVNGVKEPTKPMSESERTELQRDLGIWEEIGQRINT